jgi:hypothetical protein
MQNRIATVIIKSAYLMLKKAQTPADRVQQRAAGRMHSRVNNMAAAGKPLGTRAKGLLGGSNTSNIATPNTQVGTPVDPANPFGNVAQTANPLDPFAGGGNPVTPTTPPIRNTVQSPMPNQQPMPSAQANPFGIFEDLGMSTPNYTIGSEDFGSLELLPNSSPSTAPSNWAQL